MTSIRRSLAPLGLALGLTLTASVPASFGETAPAAATQQASSGVRCFMSTNTGAGHESTSGWVCFPQYHSSSARQS